MAQWEKAIHREYLETRTIGWEIQSRKWQFREKNSIEDSTSSNWAE